MPVESEIALKPHALIKVFFGCGLSAIPIVRDQAIKNYLSQEKTMARVHTESFFREDLLRLLPELIEKKNDEDFFRELDAKSPASIPVVEAQTFSLTTLSLPAFNMRFRPLLELGDADYRRILEDVGAPVLVFNSRRDLIFRNKACRRLLRLLQSSLGGRQNKIEDYLPPEFFSLLEKHDPERVYELTTAKGERMARYRLARLELALGELTAVTFLTLGTERAGF